MAATFNRAASRAFYARISAGEGMSVTEFQQELSELFGRHRSTIDLNDYRLSRGVWKNLADEISPVSRFLRLRDIKSGLVRFPLDSQPPDCWWWETAQADPIGVEVTIALGRTRYHLQGEMVREGIGRGFLGVWDDAPQMDFDRALGKGRATYTSAHALAVVKRSICQRLAKKNDPKLEGFVLLVQAPLTLLPNDRWAEIRPTLQAMAASLPLREVHVIGNTDERLRGFQIK